MIVEAQIREALRARLEPVPGLRDHITFDEVDIPDEFDGHWCVVSCGDELINQLTLGNPTTGAKQQHTLDVNIDVIYLASTVALEQAEKILEAAVPAIFADPRLGGLVKSIVAIGKTRVKNGDAKPLARLRLQCQTVFQTFDRDPTRSV